MNAHSRYVSYHIISSPSLHLPSLLLLLSFPLFPLSPLQPPHSPTSFLDLSFNHITCIENLEGLLILEKLFLIQNKIPRIENLSSLTCLTMLELGSNRIRVSGRSERHTEALSMFPYPKLSSAIFFCLFVCLFLFICLFVCLFVCLFFVSTALILSVLAFFQYSIHYQSFVVLRLGSTIVCVPLLYVRPPLTCAGHRRSRHISQS